MPDNAPVILAVDGPPGAGKTSLLARIAPAYGDACAFFTEPNARLAGPLPAPEDGSAAGLSRWFLRHEQTRARQVAALSADPLTRLILCDRNHLGVLAFCHAAAGDALPYDQALASYQQDIAPNLHPELKTVILLVSPDVSLERRGGAAERPRWQQWFSRDLLGRLRDFYAGTAPGLCPSPPLVIDTDQLTPAGVARQVQQLLPGPAAGSPPPGQSPPSAQRPAVAPVFGDLYAEAGGLEALGHPLTKPFPYRGGQVQIFQLGALHQDSNGQARLWDPLTAALPGMAARP